MKALFLIILIYILSTAENVRDFGPTNIGSQWKYFYFSDYIEKTGGKITTDSQTVVIIICQSFQNGSDSMLQLKITETGLRIIHWYGPLFAPEFDTISRTYFDSIVIKGDSLFKKTHFDSNYLYTDYKCPIFPFWKSHAIEPDSLQLENLLGSAKYTLHFREPYSTGFRNSVYIQNVGLYRDTIYWSRGSLAQNISIHLLSFAPSENSVHKIVPVQNNQQTSIVYRLTTYTKSTYLHGTPLITIDGKKKISNKQCIPGCYIFEKDAYKH